MSGNAVTIVGNITRDPELRFTPSGQANASFGLAVNRRWQNRQTSEWEEATSFFDVVCWREMAEHASESLTRGTRVIVTGRLEQRSWETQDGDKRSKIEVIADEIGPSLRWATAQVAKSERQGSGNQGGGGGNYGNQGGYDGGNQGGGNQNQGGNNYAKANAGGGSYGSSSGNNNASAPAENGWGHDEEPF